MENITLEQIKRQSPIEAFKKGLFSISIKIPAIIENEETLTSEIELLTTFEVVEEKNGFFIKPDFTPEYVREKFEDKLRNSIKIDIDLELYMSGMSGEVSWALRNLAKTKLTDILLVAESTELCINLLEKEEWGNAYIEASILSCLLSNFKNELWAYNWLEWLNTLERYIMVELGKSTRQKEHRKKINQINAIIDTGIPIHMVIKAHRDRSGSHSSREKDDEGFLGRE